MRAERVLVTGASAGIGVELARCFAKDKSDLILVARRKERLEELAAELQGEYGVDVRVMPADLAVAEQRQALFDDLQREGIEVDVLVNNAGFGLNGKFHVLDMERQMDMVSLNIAALTQLTRLFLPAMVERDRGGVLNVASTASFQAGPKMALYYASKAFVLSLSEAIHEELSDTRVTVSCLCPGPTTTEFGQVADMEDKPLFKFAPMSAASVAKIGFRGFRQNKAIVIAGLGNWLLAHSSRMMPRWISRKVAKQLQ